jgi:DNA-binding winged helix-turn-helix (wHTH) protein/tetratricopeptide (TPR) repeat protein
MKEIFQFGEFRLDVDDHTVVRLDGTKNGTLTEKSFQVLVLLVRRHGHLVTKDELIRFVWPDTIVEDNNLEKCIHHIRQFLGDSADQSKYIETVRKHGYRFVGCIQKMEVSGSWLAVDYTFGDLPGEASAIKGSTIIKPEVHPEREAPPRAEPVAKSAPLSRSRLVLPAIVLAAVVIVAGSAYYLLMRGVVVADGRMSMAVLPLRSVDGANRSEAYEIGIADLLIQRLSSIKGLVVRPLSATRKYNAVDIDPIAVGREQKVDYVLASSYQIASGRIRVTSQFMNVATGKTEDTFTVTTDTSNLFTAQDMIANDLANRLFARFGRGAVQFQAGRGTDNEEAYKAYLTAMNLSEERGIQNVMKCLEYLDRAVALDPNYAIAWAEKARVHNDIVGHTDAGQKENYERSMEAIRNALAIDPNLAEAYTALCYNKNRYEYDFAGAEAACRHAVELQPNSPAAHKSYANYLYTRGRFDEAIGEIKTAIDLQPVSYRNQQIYALTLYFARRFPEAEEQFKRLLELNPNHVYIYGRLINVLEQEGKEAEAFEYLLTMLTTQKTPIPEVERYKAAYRKSGWLGVVAEQVRTAEAEENPHLFEIACLQAKLGNKDEAFADLEKALRVRSFQISVLQVEPRLDVLHNDPRFADLVRRIEGK